MGGGRGREAAGDGRAMADGGVRAGEEVMEMGDGRLEGGVSGYEWCGKDAVALR